MDCLGNIMVMHHNGSDNYQASNTLSYDSKSLFCGYFLSQQPLTKNPGNFMLHFITDWPINHVVSAES